MAIYDERAPMAIMPARRAYQTLRFAFTIAPIVMGLDKFFNILVPWTHYLSPTISQVLPVSPTVFMQAVGVVEIIAGLIVAFYPLVGAWVVAAWLWAIIVNLLLVPGYYDIAIRDFGLSLGAVALARLSAAFRVGTRSRVFSSEEHRSAA